MDYQNVKGTQDYLPEAEKVRRDIRRTLEDVFIQYGCQPLETPILNYSELLASKYGGGAEILEEMYTLSDRGERELALRYDLTIPFAKVIAMNPAQRMPFKRYEIGKVFRDGPVKRGRFREFTQCDVDIVGVDSKVAEAELMIMAIDAFKKLKLEILIQYNNRKLLVGLLEEFGISINNMNKTILILDKLEKVGVMNVLKELTELNVERTTIDFIEKFLKEEEYRSFQYLDTFSSLNRNIKEGLKELEELKSYLSYLGIDGECVFNPFLARGLEIYTGSVYEIFLKDASITSSIGSGGRYDNAIGGLLGSDQTFSTVGISFGLDVIYEALNPKERIPNKRSEVDYIIIPMGAVKEALSVATALRRRGYVVELEMSQKKIGKLLNKANKDGVGKVVVIGEDEVKRNQITIKDMNSGKETTETYVFNERQKENFS
ncbi:histidine--tRNA ligase [Rossellomorea aquimaris]|nr:histidine--tRNA ligase [Rossellomorea aquimaris]